jgi:hypothetical protein
MTYFIAYFSKSVFKDLLICLFLRLWMKRFSMEVTILYFTDAFEVESRFWVMSEVRDTPWLVQ